MEGDTNAIEYDLTCAAALMGRLFLLQACIHQNRENLSLTAFSPLANPFKSAVAGANIDIIDYLLQAVGECNIDSRECWWVMLTYASELGKITVVSHLLASSEQWVPDLKQ